MSESTSGVVHSAETSTHTTPTQLQGHKDSAGEAKKSVKHFPTLPEDIGRQTAVSLIEEIVKVVDNVRAHQSLHTYSTFLIINSAAAILSVQHSVLAEKRMCFCHTCKQ